MKIGYFNQILFIIKYHKISFLRLIILLMTSSALEIFGLGLVVPYVGLIINPDIIHESKFFSFVNFFIESKDYNSTILYLGIFLLLIFFFRAIFSILLNKSILTYCYNQGMKIKLNLMEIYLRLPFTDFYKKNKSEYLYHINNLSQQFSSQILLSLVRIICDGFIMVTIIIFLSINYGFQLTIVVSIIISFLFFYDLIFKTKLTNYGKNINTNSENLIRYIQEGLSGFKEIRILNKESFFINHLKRSAQNFAIFNVKSRVITHAPRYLLDFIVIFSVFIMIVVSQYFNSIELIDYVPLLSVFALAAIRIIPSANVILRGINHIRFGKNTVKRIYNDMQSNSSNKINKIENYEPFNSLILEQVYFKYPGQNKMIIENINIEIFSGQAIGIIGSSGAGKSTLLDLILGFLTPLKGNIKYNNLNLLKNLKVFQSQVAYLPQNIFLIDDTIRKNITLDENISFEDDKKILEALNQAQLHEFIDTLPKGIDTNIGDSGAFISGGQSQRIAIARAIYQKKRILVLDESTNSLDKHTEESILNQFSKIKKSITIIFVSHKLSSLKFCDKIYKIEKGKIKLVDRNIKM